MKEIHLYHNSMPDKKITLRWQLDGPLIDPAPSENPLSAFIWRWLRLPFACGDKTYYQITEWQSALKNEEAFWNAIRTLQKYGFHKINNFV